MSGFTCAASENPRTGQRFRIPQPRSCAGQFSIVSLLFALSTRARVCRYVVKVPLLPLVVPPLLRHFVLHSSGHSNAVLSLDKRSLHTKRWCHSLHDRHTDWYICMCYACDGCELYGPSMVRMMVFKRTCSHPVCREQLYGMSCASC